MSEARDSLSELLNGLDKSQHFYRTTILHAPPSESGWSTLSDLVSLTETQAVRMLNRIDEDELDGIDAEIPALTPNLSKNLGQRIENRRAGIARDEETRQWKAAQAKRRAPGMRVH